MPGFVAGLAQPGKVAGVSEHTGLQQPNEATREVIIWHVASQFIGGISQLGPSVVSMVKVAVSRLSLIRIALDAGRPRLSGKPQIRDAH